MLSIILKLLRKSIIDGAFIAVKKFSASVLADFKNKGVD